MVELLNNDIVRYGNIKKMPKFQQYLRKAQTASNGFLKLVYKVLFVYYRNKNHIEMGITGKIGGVVYRTSLLYNRKFKKHFGEKHKHT